MGSGRGAGSVKFREREREPGNYVREAEGEEDFKVLWSAVLNAGEMDEDENRGGKTIGHYEEGMVTSGPSDPSEATSSPFLQ